MKYIAHHRCREMAANGERLNIPYGTELETEGHFIVTVDGTPICFQTSAMAKRYFARNDDGKGLERGALTYAIAYSNRERRNSDGTRCQRFTDEEIEMLERDWSHFLRHDVDVILFNEDFFAEDPDELQKLADALNIKIRR